MKREINCKLCDPDNAGRFQMAAIGEVLWDVFPEEERFGGAPANFICHCAAMGAQAAIVSCIGRDDRGAGAKDFLERHHIDTSALAVHDTCETGVVLVELQSDGQPRYEIKEDVAWDHIPWSDHLAHLASRMDAVCFGSLAQRHPDSRATIERFLAATSETCLRVFDVNLRQHFYTEKSLRNSLGTANVLKLNDEELSILAGLTRTDSGPVEVDAYETIVRHMLDAWDLKLVILTCGATGAWMITPEASSYTEAPSVEVVSTVGAGDSFTAAAVMGYLSGAPLDAVNRHAARVAAYVCTQRGAVPQLPDELSARFNDP